MTDIDNVPLRPKPPIQEPQQKKAKRAFAWPRAAAMVGVLAFGVALGAGGLAAAAGMNAMGWREGARLAFLQGAVTHALDSVGASADQEAKIHDIVAAKFVEIAPKPDDHEALRKQALALLAAPTIDRAAVERLRADTVAIFDAKSKAIVAAVLDVADQLTPEQRARLAAGLPETGRRGPPFGPWGMHGPGMGGAPDGGPGKE